MKFIKMEIDPLLYFPEPKSTLEWELEGDIPQYEATGYFQPPMLDQQEINNEADV